MWNFLSRDYFPPEIRIAGNCGNFAENITGSIPPLRSLGVAFDGGFMEGKPEHMGFHIWVCSFDSTISCFFFSVVPPQLLCRLYFRRYTSSEGHTVQGASIEMENGALC